MNKKIQPASVLQCEHLAKTFHDGALHVEVLTRVNLSIKPAERIAIVGTSGSGKSTLSKNLCLDLALILTS